MKDLIKSVAILAGDQESVVILGQGAIRDEDGLSVLSKAMELAEKTGSKFLNLHTVASRVGALDIGAVADGELSAEIANADVIYNLGADEIELPERVFVIFNFYIIKHF